MEVRFARREELEGINELRRAVHTLHAEGYVILRVFYGFTIESAVGTKLAQFRTKLARFCSFPVKRDMLH